MRKSIYRRILLAALTINIIAIAFFGIKEFNNSIPDNINMFVNQEGIIKYSYPISAEIKDADKNVMSYSKGSLKDTIHFDINKEGIKIISDKTGTYKMDLKLFGFFHLKSINVDIIDPIELIPCGSSIGIYIQTKGILVLGTSPVLSVDGLNYEPAINILKSGDYITAVNDKEVESKTELINELQNCKEGYAKITLRRGNEILNVKVDTIKCPEGNYRIGVWVRDDTQGIGTLTFIDKDKNFGALGHGITDVDTSLLMEVNSGSIYKSDIMTVIKGKKGEPGEIVGLIRGGKENNIGEIELNTNQGIYGKISSNYSKFDNENPLPIGLIQEVKKGKAYIKCDVDGTVKEYEINIEKIEKGNKNKGMVISITDKNLLSITNGIVQGMSGSPIIQNGKIIGAVTHVFVQDSTKGYGIFIENMLKSYK